MNPDLTGKTAIVTGANSGIGLATAKALAGYGARVVFAVRDTVKGRSAAVAAPGDVEVRHLDLADLASIRRFAADWREPIHLLINNAGVSVPELERTVDGFELQFGTNHLGPFALTNLLLPYVTGRVVTLASQSERMGRINLDDLNWERTAYKQSSAYATSKLANVLFSSELQRRLNAAGSSVLAVAAHPGLVATNMYDRSTGLGTRLMLRLLAQDPEEGALPVLYAATGDVPGDGFTGPEHWMHMRGGAELISRSKTARDADIARQLWDASEKLTGVSFGL
ncbi:MULTISPECIES: oxidoreductase [Streptomyces]|uniref:oxidoreductase n=1 Tax=Streptomyces TaxID=1883 RepID=UPI002D809EE3|nr:oxidoreductase [Streptomyces sp. GMR22]